MKRNFYLICSLLLIAALHGCATVPTAAGDSFFPVHENACRNYHRLLTSKGQRYKCAEIYSNGDKYDGQFINDFVQDGYGIYYWTDSRRYEGNWVNGVKQGMGIFYFAPGGKYSKYEGNFWNNKFNGQGKVIDLEGKVVREGLFENGEFITNTVIEQRKRAAEEERVANERRMAVQRAEEERRSRERELFARQEKERIEREGDGSPDDALCKKYGLKPQTSGYAECRMRIDFAKAESKLQQEKYEREQAEYQRQLAEIEREKQRRRGAAFMELGGRMMGGQSPISALGSLGTGAPIAPSQPSSFNHTITLPNGRMINCTTMGTMTNCL